MDREKAKSDIADIINNMEKRNAHYYVEENGRSIQKEAFADCRAIAEELVNAGYGNIEQALTEFAERLKKNKDCYANPRSGAVLAVTIRQIDETLKEMTGK